MILERTPEVNTSPKPTSLCFHDLVAYDRQLGNEQINCQYAAIILACDIRTIWAIKSGEAALDEQADLQLKRWQECGRPHGEYELPSQKGNYGSKGLVETFRNVMDDSGYGYAALPYYLAGSILGVGQCTIWRWYWRESPVPSAACHNLAAARRAQYQPPYAATNLQRISWKRKQYKKGYFR